MNKNKEIKNILLIALNENFCKKVSSLLSQKLDMFNLDCHDLIVYDLINPKEVIEKCGIEYFQKRECGVVRGCADYLNTCISINYDLIFKYKDFFKNSLIVYLKLPFEKITKVPSKIDFENRNAFLEKISDDIISLDKKSCNTAINKIIDKLGERYENS